MPRKSPVTKSSNVPAVYKPSLPPAVIQQKPSLLSSMKEGFAMGTGMALARNMVDRILSPSSSSHIQEPMMHTHDLCKKQEMDYRMCMRMYHNDFQISCSKEKEELDSCSTMK